MVTPVQIAWAAGFIEGEGCPHTSKGPAINATQVQREPLDRLAAILGCGKVSRYSYAKRPDQQPYWRWTCYGAPAIGVMMTIYSFMSPRRKQQIQEVIQQWHKGTRNRNPFVLPRRNRRAA